MDNTTGIIISQCIHIQSYIVHLMIIIHITSICQIISQINWMSKKLHYHYFLISWLYPIRFNSHQPSHKKSWKNSFEFLHTIVYFPFFFLQNTDIWCAFSLLQDTFQRANFPLTSSLPETCLLHLPQTQVTLPWWNHLFCVPHFLTIFFANSCLWIIN